MQCAEKSIGKARRADDPRKVSGRERAAKTENLRHRRGSDDERKIRSDSQAPKAAIKTWELTDDRT